MQLDDACIKMKLFIADLPVMVQKIDGFSRLSSVLGELQNKPSLSMYPMSKNIPSTSRGMVWYTIKTEGNLNLQNNEHQKYE